LFRRLLLIDKKKCCELLYGLDIAYAILLPMKAPAGGYTLLEVMIFLAISSTLFAATVAVIRGQSAQAQFSTSVNDVNSKINQWIDDVSNGFTGTSAGSSDTESDFICTVRGVGGGRTPELKVGTGTTKARGTNSDCVFLGKMILVNESSNSTQLVAAPIVGLRADADGENINNIQDTEPIAGINAPGNLSDVDLSDRYTIPNGTRVLSAHEQGCTDPTVCSHMAGFFTSLDNFSTGNGAQNLWAVQYPFYHKDSNIDDPSVYQCVMLDRGSECKTPPSKNLWPMKSWDLCLATVRGNNRALLSIISSNGLGARTKLVTGKSDVCS
jgi:hypothetical protein